jgi:hypothetical protein
VNNKPREICVKVNGDSTVGVLKQLVAEPVPTLLEKIRICFTGNGPGIDETDSSLEENDILDRTRLVYYVRA